MSNTESKYLTVIESILVTVVFSFLCFMVSSFGVILASVCYMDKNISMSSSFFWDVAIANTIVIFFILVFLPVPVKLPYRIIGLLIMFAITGYSGIYKQSTIHYYLNYGSYMNPELYPEGSNQRKLVTDVVAHRDIQLFGEYDRTYFVKPDIDKLGNMTNFFITYGDRNDQMKAYQARFKELLNSSFFTAWDYSKFENEVIEYLISSESSLQQSESVSMLHTIKFGV
jgi:hypothetical protein